MHNYLDLLEKEINYLIESNDLNAALESIRKFVESILTDDRAVANVYGSLVLDHLCQKIGQITLDFKSITFVTVESQFNDEIVIYVATELYNTGGHTAVLVDFIKAAPHKKHVILLTNIFESQQESVIKSRFCDLDIEVSIAPKGTLLDKLIWLQDKLFNRKPSQVFLFNHHQDSVAIASVQPNLMGVLIFYHHCDHNICLGLYLKYAQHIDLHSFGFDKCRNSGVCNVVYVPLVVEDLGGKSIKKSFMPQGKLRTCTSGNRSKFERSCLYPYVEVLPKLLEVTGGIHIHIGSLSQDSLQKIYKALDERSISQESFIYIPWVESIWQAMHDQGVDIYLSSFPVGGARASVEVMGSGTPIVGYKNYNSRLLSIFDIIYPESYFWDKPESLYNYLQNLNAETLQQQSVYSRNRYEAFHRFEILVSCLKGIENKNSSLQPPAMGEYNVEEIQAFLEQNTLYIKLKEGLNQTKEGLNQIKEGLNQTKEELNQTKEELNQTKEELRKNYSLIKSMESSKFWKLRKAFFKVMQLLGLKKED